jgi:hypothetical protein
MKPAAESLQESLKVVNGGLGQNRPGPQPLALISTKNGERPQKQEANPDQDLEFDCNVENPSLIPKGIYTVSFLRAEKEYLWGREKIFLWFQIMDFGEFQGEKLYLACNAPKKAKKGKVATSSKYYQLWVLAAGRRPDRYDRMSTKIFRGKVFRAQVRIVTTNARNLVHSPLLQYPIIDDLVERLTDSETD